MTRDRFHLIVVVWGSWHTERFLRFSLPSLLAPRNIPAAAARKQLQLTILTTAAEQDVISSAPIVGRIRQTMPVNVRVMPGGHPKGIERHLSAWRVMFDACKTAGEVLVVLHPDVVCSDGVLGRLIAAFDDPRVAVSVKTMSRVLGEILEPALEDMKSPDGVLAVPAPDLARLSMAHMHHYSGATHQNSRIFRPTWEGLFVGPEGFAHSCASYEFAAIDPRAADATSHFTLYDSAGPQNDVIADLGDGGLSASLTPFAKSLELLCPAVWDPPFEVAKGTIQELLRPVCDLAIGNRPYVFAGRPVEGEDTAAFYARQAYLRFYRPVTNYMRLIELHGLVARRDGMDAMLLQLCMVNVSALKRMPVGRPAVVYLPTASVGRAVLEGAVSKPPAAMRHDLQRQIKNYFGFLDQAETPSAGRLLNKASFSFRDGRITWSDGRDEAVGLERTRFGDLVLFNGGQAAR